MRSLLTLAAATAVAAVLPLTAGVTAANATGSTIAWAHISAGGPDTCGVSTVHALYCWGLVGTTESDVPTAVTTPAATGWANVSAALNNICATRTNRTLWCGPDTTGALKQVTTPSAGGWAAIGTGDDHICATRTDGTLWCWGNNAEGQLGIGNTTSETLPQQVTTPAATGWATINSGSLHSCATRTDGSLWCWGDNSFGELGIGSTTNADVPQQVTTPTATGWATVSAGGAHTCATRADATLWCWGDGFVGELGIGNATNQDLPQQVTTPAATGWATVTNGENFTCGTRAGGTLWCWGFNGSGRLGIGSSGNKSVPQQVAKSATTPWATVSAGGDHACATRTNRTLWCWGANTFGQLGLGNTTTQTRPKQVTA
jgi:alpha-tubulin suppressor-like RCC1 family protein